MGDLPGETSQLTRWNGDWGRAGEMEGFHQPLRPLVLWGLGV